MDETTSQIQQDNRLDWKAVFFSKKLRMLIVGAFVVIAFFTIGIRILTSASIKGVVNAPILLIQSPIDGVVISDNLTAGQTVEAGTELFVIKNDRLDTTNVDRVRSELEQSKALLAGLAARIRGYEELRDSLNARLQSHLDSNKTYLGLKAAEAESKLSKAKDALEQARRDFARQQGLAGKGVDSKQAYDDALTRHQQAASEVSASEAAFHRAKAELDANEKGVLLDGYSGAPYAQQRLDEVSLRLAEAEADRDREEQRSAALRRQLANEEATVKKLSDSRVLAPSLSLVQSVRVAQSSDVVKGTVLCELVDCAKSYVEATIPESRFDKVRIGQAAKVYLYGNSRAIPGTVISVRGAGANNASNPSNFAARVQKTTPDSMIVNVGISAEDLIKVFGSANQVGRTARVKLVR